MIDIVVARVILLSILTSTGYPMTQERTVVFNHITVQLSCSLSIQTKQLPPSLSGAEDYRN